MTQERDEHERIALRARFEEIEVEVIDEEFATATNLSHGDDPESRWEHSYVLEIDDEVVVGCSCPDHQYRGRRCKHIVATQRAIREADHSLESDGGVDECPHGHAYCPGHEADEERPELCPDCWDEWAAYDPDDHLLEEDEAEAEDADAEDSLATARELIAAGAE